MTTALRIRVAIVNAVCYPAVWWMSRADRNVCRFANVTDDCPACPFPDDRPDCCHDGAES